jgi:hypothetical protein
LAVRETAAVHPFYFNGRFSEITHVANEDVGHQ